MSTYTDWRGATADGVATAAAPTAFGPRATAELFAAIGLRLAGHAATDTALHDLTLLAAAIVPGARWVSVSRHEDADRYATVAASDRVAAEADRLQYGLGVGPSVGAASDSAPTGSPDLRSDAQWREFGSRAAREHGTQSVLSVPLPVAGGEDLHARLNMYGDHVDAFDDVALSLSTLLVTHAAVAVAAVVHREVARDGWGGTASHSDVGVAVGVVMASRNLDRVASRELLERASRHSGRTLHDVATQVADTGVLDLAPFPPTDR